MVVRWSFHPKKNHATKFVNYLRLCNLLCICIIVYNVQHNIFIMFSTKANFTITTNWEYFLRVKKLLTCVAVIFLFPVYFTYTLSISHFYSSSSPFAMKRFARAFWKHTIKSPLIFLHKKMLGDNTCHAYFWYDMVFFPFIKFLYSLVTPFYDFNT